MTRILLNYDVSSLYPNLVRLYGYVSRNQRDKNAYTDLLKMRMKAKHNELSEDFLKPLSLTNSDLKSGLKLPLNAYTGTLRAPFNPLYDNLQGFSICITGQLFILQLIHDLKEIPTLQMVEANTDAVKFYIDSEHKNEALDTLKKWQELTGLELEEDNVVKCIARDVNNYAEIVQIGDNNYDIHYKGGLFSGNHIFKWDKDNKIFHYSFEDDLKSNSLTICAEAILKNLLFDIPVEDTINKCNDIFRFQMITHLGHTYDRCVLEYPNGNVVELQRNNRVYAGKNKNNGKIYKVKDLKKDSLANCPPNPIVDNKNEATIDDVNKTWYIKYAKQKISDFKGRKEIYMEDKLKNLKKDELIAMINDIQSSKANDDTTAINSACDSINENETCIVNCDGEETKRIYYIKLLKKINNFRLLVREHNFQLDKVLPTQMGGGEIYSLGQVYECIQQCCVACGLDFRFDVVDVINFIMGIYKPRPDSLPQHLSTVKCIITLTDLDTGAYQMYSEISQGCDISDKGVNGAASSCVRQWLDKNFTPHTINGKVVNYYDEETGKPFDIEAEQSVAPTDYKVEKAKAFIPADKANAIAVDVINKSNEKKADVNPVINKDIDEIKNLIDKYRQLSGNEKAGQKTLDGISKQSMSEVELLNAKLTIQNEVAKLETKVE